MGDLEHALETARQMHAKSGPIYDKWLEKWLEGNQRKADELRRKAERDALEFADRGRYREAEQP